MERKVSQFSLALLCASLPVVATTAMGQGIQSAAQLVRAQVDAARNPALARDVPQGRAVATRAITYDPGSTTAPGPRDATGACCVELDCVDTTTQLDCMMLRGRWFSGEDCYEGFVCPPPETGACCVELECTGTLPQADCLAQGGRWFRGEDCDAGFVCSAPAGCQHRVDLYDCFGDGWQDTTSLDVLVNGEIVLMNITLVSGAGPESYYFYADTGDVIETLFLSEGGDYEPYYFVYDGPGYLLGQDGIIGSNCNVSPRGLTLTGHCETPTLGACCHYYGEPCQQTSAADCIDGVWLGLGSQCFQCQCLVPCPEGATPEPEACGENTDGGCDASPHAWAYVHSGETICGTAWADANGKDTDWYLFTADTKYVYEWRVQAEFPVQFKIIKAGTDDPCVDYSVITYTGGNPCSEETIRTPVQEPGQYFFWVAPSMLRDYPCPLRYIATLTCIPVTGACCTLEAPYCQEVLEPDCTAIGGTWLGDLTTCSPKDCDGNGICDACEYALGLQQNCNFYANDTPDNCDIAAGTSCDCNGDGIPDECELWSGDSGESGSALHLDKGSSENAFGYASSVAGNLVWINHMTAHSPGMLKGIYATFGSPMFPRDSGVVPGQEFRVYVWSDPVGQGNPADAVFVEEATGYISDLAIETDRFQLVTLSAFIPVSGSFFIGAGLRALPSRFPAPVDTNSWLGDPDQSFIWGCYADFDPTNFVGYYLHAMSEYFAPRDVFMLRALVDFEPPPHDCNNDGIPDECEIAVEFGGKCVNAGGPCWPGTCDTDYNHDGIPDRCQFGRGDFDEDGDVDNDDYRIFVGAFGTCLGQPDYVALCDLDGDNCITLADYQLWRLYYKMYNHTDFQNSVTRADGELDSHNGKTVQALE